MEKKYVIIVMILMIILQTGCGKKVSEVDLGNLQNANGDYQYKNISWGSAMVDVEKVLGVSFGQADHETEQGTTYIVQGAYAKDGIPAVLTCEFDLAGKCKLVGFRFKPGAESAQAFWESLIKELSSQYGDAAPEIHESVVELTQTAIRNEVYLWEKNLTIHTVLSATKISMDDTISGIEVNVYLVPEGR